MLTLSTPHQTFYHLLLNSNIKTHFNFGIISQLSFKVPYLSQIFDSNFLPSFSSNTLNSPVEYNTNFRCKIKFSLPPMIPTPQQFTCCKNPPLQQRTHVLLSGQAESAACITFTINTHRLTPKFLDTFLVKLIFQALGVQPPC